MSILTIILVLLAFAVVAVVALAASKPDAFRIARSISIAAPSQAIFPLINDFHRWGAWSPFEEMDPTMTRTYSGAEAGPGSVYEWTGNGQAGAGRMEILKSDPASEVLIKLDFSKPMVAHNTACFTFAPNGDATTVTWAMEGRRPFMHKLMGVVFNMDKMVGGMFEQGLGKMKAAAEGA